MKKNILLLCGGQSEEHEISLISATNVLEALDRNQFEPIVVPIAKSGIWYLGNEKGFASGDRADSIKITTGLAQVSLAPYLVDGRGCLFQGNQKIPFDAVFPILHGTKGEDGTLQGLLEIVGVPYVGADCGVSAICMDKVLTKTICAHYGIASAPFVALRKIDQLNCVKKDIEALGLPLFVKPSRAGSSVGVSKVTDLADLKSAVTNALRFDNCCLIEKEMKGREIEVAVLGTSEHPKASLPGEIIPSAKSGFYSYQAKYLDAEGAKLEMPAKLSDAQAKEVQAFSKRIYSALQCEGMARVDLFLSDEGLYLNEVNTIPGFTPISMYPKLWELSGLSYSDLITELIHLAFQRSEAKS